MFTSSSNNPGQSSEGYLPMKLADVLEMACPSRYDALRSRPRNILTAGYASQSEKLIYMCSVQIIRGDESKSFCSMFTQDKRWCLLYWVLHISYCKEAKVIGLYLETSLRPCMGPQFMCLCR